MGAVPTRYVFAGWLPFTGLGFLGITIMAGPRRRNAVALFMSLVGIAALGLLISCGGGNRTTSPGISRSSTYPITVTGTSGNLTRTTTFNLTVN